MTMRGLLKNCWNANLKKKLRKSEMMLTVMWKRNNSNTKTHPLSHHNISFLITATYFEINTFFRINNTFIMILSVFLEGILPFFIGLYIILLSPYVGLSMWLGLLDRLSWLICVFETRESFKKATKYLFILWMKKKRNLFVLLCN